MSSRMPQRYIDREGLEQENIARVVKTGQVEQLEYDNSILSRRLAILEDTMNKLLAEDVAEAQKILQKAKEQMNNEIFIEK